MSASGSSPDRLCPWCRQTLVPVENLTSNKHGMLRESRCAACHRLISVRLVEAENLDVGPGGVATTSQL